MFSIFSLIHVDLKIFREIFFQKIDQLVHFFHFILFSTALICLLHHILISLSDIFFFMYLDIFLNFLYFYIELLFVHALILIYVIYHSRKLQVDITTPDSSILLKIFPRLLLHGLLTMWILSFLPFWKILLVYLMKNKVCHIFYHFEFILFLIKVFKNFFK